MQPSAEKAQIYLIVMNKRSQSKTQEMTFHQHKRLEKRQNSQWHKSEGFSVTYYNYRGSIEVFLESPRHRKGKAAILQIVSPLP